jgi:gas vesicle protein
MRTLFAFLVGIAVGAAAALLFAPVAGEELRSQLAEQASSQWETAQVQWHKRMESMQGQIASLQAQVQTLGKQHDADEVVEVELELE